MLSKAQQITRATRFFEFYLAKGINMSKWLKLRTSPATLSAEQCVLLCRHVDCDLPTLFSHGIGVENKIDDFVQLKIIPALATDALATA